MPDIRQTVLDELERRGWSRTKLTRAVADAAKQRQRCWPFCLPGLPGSAWPSQRQILGWLADTRGMAVSRVEPVLEVLGLEVRRVEA